MIDAGKLAAALTRLLEEEKLGLIDAGESTVAPELNGPAPHVPAGITNAGLPISFEAERDSFSTSNTASEQNQVPEENMDVLAFENTRDRAIPLATTTTICGQFHRFLLTIE